MTFKKIMIIGGNGKVGRLLIPLLIKEGYSVKAMVRDANQKTPLEELGAEVVIGDLELDFQNVLKGVDTLVFTAGSGSKTGPDKTIAVDQNGAVRTIEWAERFGIRRYIMVSAQGSREPNEASKIQHYYKAKSMADNRLGVSGLKYTIFRPGRLTDDEGSGKVTISKHLLERSSTSRANLAQLIALSVNHMNTFGKTIEVIEGNTPIQEALDTL